MKRTKHSLSHYVLPTFDMGQLVPVSNIEVLPGDSIRMSTSALIRLSPLATPVMHPVTVRLHHWFVPYRILSDEWEDFITGGSDGSGDGAAVPILTTTASWDESSLPDYLGYPPIGGAGFNVVAFPILAYNRIYNEFYRDQDLQAEVAEDNIEILNCAWEKDQFTAARPWTQKGPDVTIPLNAPVTTSSTDTFTAVGDALRFRVAATGAAAAAQLDLGTGTGGALNSKVGSGYSGGLYPSNLEVVGAEASINDFRMAFALQRYQEARAQYGSRYTEYLRYLGVRSSDARLQRPEYLGGGRATVSISEVLRTGDDPAAPDPEAPIGEMRGHGIAALRSRRWIRFFEEHGVVLTLASVRPRAMYSDGLHRSWSRGTKEEFWQKELELVGQDFIRNSEVYAAHASPGGVFGYQDRYYSYRHLPSRIAGEFRTTLNDWHLARIFGSSPALNADFVKCVPSKRIFAEQTQHSLWCMFSHSIQARRMVGKRTIGRLM